MGSGAIKLDSQQAVSTGTYLELLSGTDRGKRMEVRSTRLSLGRAEDNDVVILAEGVSRRHAFMALSDGDWFIRDNDSKNGVLVNGERLKESWLTNGDIVALGDFVFRFHHAKAGASPYGDAANLPAAASGSGALAEGAPAGGVGSLASENLSSPVGGSLTRKQGANGRVILYGGTIVLLAGLYFLLPGEKTTPSAEEPQSATGRLARDFEVSQAPPDKLGDGRKLPVGIEDPLLKKAEQEMSSLDWSDSSLQQAELFFRRGQRDYLNRNYHRAIEAFQTALSLYQGHSLAERYLRHAIAEAEAQAKKSLALGVQYFEALQYQRAIYFFREAIQLMAHRPEEPMIKEAQRYIQQSEMRLRAAELFP